jgi:aspartate kinase
MPISMPIVIQKFGGTSVGTGERMQHVAGIIAATLRERPVIAVVSAMSGSSKAEGTTSLIMRAFEQAVLGQPFRKELASIKANHLKTAEQVASEPSIRQEVEVAIRDEMNRMASLLKAIQVIRELPTRSRDVLLGAGERLSARLLAACLRQTGTEADYIDLSDVVDEQERAVEGGVDPGFVRRLQTRLAEVCLPRPGRVPVVTGFFGMVPGGLLRAVGRGYTDFTAALIAAGLGRERVDEMQVWKEVDGIFTADPRRVPEARPLPTISPSEASELTYFGSEVLHPFTMERVVSAGIPIRIKNTFRPEAPGTVIVARREEARPRVTAVTAKRGISVVTVQSNRMYNAYGFLANVFKSMADLGVIVDLVSTSEVSLSMTVDRQDDLERIRSALSHFGSVEVMAGRAILSMVGEGMKYVPGTAGQMFSALGKAGVNIEMISQGASEINISCVIKEEDAEKGLRAVHQSFLETA